ncbi:uncharacterized protein KY384_002373 [Bacidia gigantensis]|uniref:uncharacterized protein n=1 Tax=Bacidia gigantensis TaxID=2732470 RepID=UPI001D059D31|nr:uncharacterized protein KY384_002373 [Bacidia gigantensis]KAG8532496.1 hypothetical protein KY384_002373 [Bacidia gigantensis]
MHVQQYLLDHSQIQDTLKRMVCFPIHAPLRPSQSSSTEVNREKYYGFDSHQLEICRKEAFASEIAIDYTQVFGGSPETHTTDSIVKSWEGLWTKITIASHALSNILPQLSLNQYHDDKKPDAVHVDMNIDVYLVRDEPDGKQVTANARARMAIEVVRQGTKEGENPWRVSKMVVHKVSADGFVSPLISELHVS